MEETILGTAAIARRLGVADSYVRRLRRQGKLPTRPTGALVDRWWAERGKKAKPASTGRKTFPLHLRVGSAQVVVYRRGGDETRRPFLLAWHVEGRRRFKSFRRLAEAEVEGRRRLAEIANGRLRVASLSDADVDTLAAARRVAAEVGKPLLEILAEYRAAVARIADRATLGDAVSAWERAAGAAVTPRTPAEVLKEFVTARKQDGCSAAYLGPLGYRLGAFAREHLKPMHLITAREVDRWLRAGGRSLVSRHHIRQGILTLAGFARARGYLPDAPLELARMERVRVRAEKPIEILTPDEIRAVLFGTEHSDALGADRVPYVALGAWAGLRPREIERLQWEDVRLAEGFIHVSAKAAKTRERRLVPITPNLAAWLKPHAQASGPVVAFARPRGMIGERLAAVGLPAKRNALRHSYASYRLAQIKNAAELAHDMGNSPAMVFRHYRELVTPAAAAEWFSIMPKKIAARAPRPRPALGVAMPQPSKKEQS